MRWELLLTGELAAEAARAARDIATAIASAPPSPDRTAAERTLFWAYASAAIDEPFANAAYDMALDELVAELQRGAPHHGLLCNGLAGMGWVLGHVLDGDAEDALAVIDEALVQVLSVERWSGHHDLVQGLVGHGVYFLDRLARGGAPIARDGLELVVGHLARAATTTADGVTWRTALELLPVDEHAGPEGRFDCGLAHGVPGVMAMLARAAAIADPPAAARSLCLDAMRWVRGRRRPGEVTGRFPAFVYPDKQVHRPRAAWCYGDPGVANALWIASASLGESLELARETALDCATRAPSACGVRDAGFCHGAAGLAHMLHRYYQASRAPIFATAARTWLARLLAMRTPDGFGGFTSWRGDYSGYQPSANLVEGAMGIGLVLFAAIAEQEPRWDRILLCDVPVAHQ